MEFFTSESNSNSLAAAGGGGMAANKDGGNGSSSSNMLMMMGMPPPNNSAGAKFGAPKYNLQKKNNSLNKSTFSFGDGFTVIAVIEGKGNDRGQIGMAVMDLRHSELNLTQFVDTSSYSLLRIRLSLYDPIEVILPQDKEKTASRALILDVIRDTCPRVAITPILRRYFNDALGIELIKKYSVEECSQMDASLYVKYYCMSAAAALIKYVEYIQNILYAENSLRIIYAPTEDSCMIDVNSWKSLDLIHVDLKPKRGSPNSLFEILNCCVTPSGMKTLKSYLLQPSANIDVIERRLDIVQELVARQTMCDRIRTILSKLGDLHQLISMCTYMSADAGMSSKEESKRVIRHKITQAVALKNLLDATKQLSATIEQSNIAFFAQMRVKLNDSRLDEIATLVNEKIASEMNRKKRKGSALDTKDLVLFAVAEKQHVLLDLARRTYQELVQRVAEYAKTEQNEIPGAILNYSQSRGYHFSLHANDPYAIRLPPHCIQIVFNKTSITFTTRELIKYNDRLMQSESEILQKSDLVMNHLLATIREHIPALYHCAELVSLLDYYCAMACYSSRVNTVRPKFNVSKMAISNGRHPILDYRKDVVPNDTFASYDTSRFAVIAGPNMAGKSTYMRQVCLLQILAQMGCMLPADSAAIIPMTRIFSRIGHNDDLVRNLSGFAVEMSEMAVILQNANPTSLIIIDELARSTSTEEGIGICYAICERLLSSGAIVLFATHFLDMAQLEANYPGVVKNYHFASMTTIDKDGNEQLAPPHVLHEGAYKGPLYGLDLAELTTLPTKIITEARELAERLRREKEIANEMSCTLDRSRKGARDGEGPVRGVVKDGDDAREDGEEGDQEEEEDEQEEDEEDPEKGAEDGQPEEDKGEEHERSSHEEEEEGWNIMRGWNPNATI